MRAISLWQPWASLWLSERKTHETRHWPLRIPGGASGVWLAVHAAKKIVVDGLDPVLRDIVDDEFGPHWAMELPRGALIGKVFVTKCVSTADMRLTGELPSGDDLACGNYEYGRYAWRRTLFSRLSHPVPYRGQQGLFSVADALVTGPLEAVIQ